MSPKKDGSPKVQSPTGKGGDFSSFMNFSKGEPTQQIMTQISSIYNKRSRSIQNQNGGVNNNSSIANDGTNQTREKSPIMRQATIGGGQPNDNSLNKSPRLNKIKNISPPSREKLGNISIQGNGQGNEDKILHSPTKLPGGGGGN